MNLPLWVTALSVTLLVQVTGSFAAAAIPLLGPVLTERWGIEPESIGYVSAAMSLGICWFLACGGPLLGHFGPVRTLQFGLLLIALGLICLAQPIAMLAPVGALLIGLGVAPNTPAGSQILKRTAPVRHLTLVFSIKQAGVPMGGVFASLIVAPLLGVTGLFGLIFVLGAVVLLSGILVQAFRKRLDVNRRMDRRWLRTFFMMSSLAKSARVLLTNPGLPLLAAMGVAFSIVQACVMAFTATYLVTRHGNSLAQAGVYVAVLLTASTVARIFLGWLADRLGCGLVLLSVLAVAAGASILLLVEVADGQPWAVYCAMAAIGASCLGWNGVHMAELARASPDELIGEVASAASLFGFVGSVCGPLFFSVTAGWTGSFSLPFLLVAGQLAVFGLASLWFTAFSQRRY